MGPALCRKRRELVARADGGPPWSAGGGRHDTSDRGGCGTHVVFAALRKGARLPKRTRPLGGGGPRQAGADECHVTRGIERGVENEGRNRNKFLNLR